MKKEKVVFYLLYSFLIVAFLLSSLEIFQENQIFMNVKYIIFVIIICYYLLFAKIKLFFINKDLSKIILILFFCFSVPTLINLIVAKDIVIFFNIILTLIYIVFLLVSIKVLIVNNFFDDLIKIIHITIFIFVVIVLFREGFNFLGFGDILRAFNVEARVRQIYGFRHANTLGNIGFIFTSVTLYRLISNKLNKIKVAIILGMLFFMLYVMLTTGSRTALTATFILVSIYILSRHVYFKSKKSNAIGIIFTFMASILLILLVFNSLSNININDLLEDSNRYYHWVNTLKFLNENMNFLIGLGFYNISYFYSGISFGSALTSDNWYIYTFMTTGAIGIFLILTVVIIFFSNLIRYQGKYNEALFSFVVSFFLVSLYYAMFEVTFFIPSELMSFLLWCTAFFYMEKIALNKQMTLA